MGLRVIAIGMSHHTATYIHHRCLTLTLVHRCRRGEAQAVSRPRCREMDRLRGEWRRARPGRRRRS